WERRPSQPTSADRRKAQRGPMTVPCRTAGYGGRSAPFDGRTEETKERLDCRSPMSISRRFLCHLSVPRDRTGIALSYHSISALGFLIGQRRYSHSVATHAASLLTQRRHDTRPRRRTSRRALRPARYLRNATPREE